MLTEMTLEEFNATLGSDAPAPGGGSVAALSGSLGAELISMCCNLSKGKKDLEVHRAVIDETLSDLESLRINLLKRVDADTDAFTEVMDAFKMPKNTEEQIEARRQAIQDGYKSAIDSPMTTARQCVDVLRTAAVLPGKFNTNAMSDFGVSVLMAHAGLEGAIMNVRINLPVVKDASFVAETEVEAAALLAEGTAIKDGLYEYVYENLG